MPTYVTPGVYFERADAGVAAIAPLRTDIAGFVGIARRGPLDLAIALQSWRQFVAYFGDFTGAGYLAYAVRGFFENGGKRCWAVRVASPIASAATRSVDAAPAPSPLSPFRPAWTIEASSKGVWGNDLEVEWRETHSAQTTADPGASMPEYLSAKSVAGFGRGTLVRAYVNPTAPEYRVVSAVDSAQRRIYWSNPRPENRLPYERPLSGYDPSRPLLIESVEYSILVFELGRLRATYEGLSTCPDHPRYAPKILAGIPDLAEGLPARGVGAPSSDARNRLDAPERSAPDPIAIVEHADVMIKELPFPAAALDRRFLQGGLDGLALLTARDFLGEDADPFDDMLTRRRKRRGLRALEPVNEVAVVAIPDILIQPAEPPRKSPLPPCAVDVCLDPPPLLPATPRQASVGDLPPRFDEAEIFQVQQALIEHCAAMRDRFALIDPPFDTVRDQGIGIGPLRAWRRRFDSDFGALYAPWLLTPDPLMLDGSGLRAVPPSGHVAGFLAQTDLRIGVHCAPANGALTWVQRTTLSIDEAVHGVLNPEHVNAIRPFAGRGIRIFGARTLSSDPDWRFVNVRRLMLMLEKAIRVGSQWAAFEPNNRVTRSKLHLALSSLLLELWRRGALAGTTAQEAFFVNCGEVQNPGESRARGLLVAEVGVAPAKPFEFVVIRVGVSDNALETVDTANPETVS